MAAWPARSPERQTQQPTTQAKGWQQTVSWRYLPAPTTLGPQESPPSRRRPVARTILDWGIVSPIMTKSGRRERIFIRFGKPPCDKRPMLGLAATTGRTPLLSGFAWNAAAGRHVGRLEWRPS